MLPVWCPEVYWGLGWTWTPSNTNPLPHQVPPTSKYPALLLAPPANDIFLTTRLVGGSGSPACHWWRVVSHSPVRPIRGLYGSGHQGSRRDSVHGTLND
ncbi:hypothetical protein E2C01_067009 [Portunus trituberculatus]|uniref:Uncharacterized protein n=1 Tax=Portunus trituberculatus TaxID=210409 RepID=A0A5B7HSA6_PORTR|nr:hypothetical protein [Portunus trituberculatus]